MLKPAAYIMICLYLFTLLGGSVLNQVCADIENYDQYLPNTSKKQHPKTDEQQAIADAKKDAAAHTNPILWISGSFFFPIIGPIASQVYYGKVPGARLIGKSPTYIAFYVDNYKIAAKKQRFNYALAGCVFGSAIYGGVAWNIFDSGD